VNKMNNCLNCRYENEYNNGKHCDGCFAFQFHWKPKTWWYSFYESIAFWKTEFLVPVRYK